MKNKYIFLFVFTMIFFPLKIKAACSNEKLTNLTLLSNNINYYYEYEENENDVSFDIVFYNLNNSFFIQNANDNSFYASKNEIRIKNFKPGSEYIFNIYPTNYCSNHRIKTIYIKLPYYNKFYKYDVCRNLDDFDYCKKWSEVTINYEQLKNKIDEYKNKEEKDKKEEKKEKYTLIDYVKKFIVEIYIENYFIFLPLTIVCLIVIIYYLDQRDKIL